jgi:hypothetical protein
LQHNPPKADKWEDESLSLLCAQVQTSGSCCLRDLG